MIGTRFVAWCRLWLSRPVPPSTYLDDEEWSADPDPGPAKHDPVAAIIRATRNHENTLDQITYDPAHGVAVLTFTQPNEQSEYPDYRLRLTFTDVRSFGIGSATQAVCSGAEVVRLSCEPVAHGYDVEVILQKSGPMWAIKLTFGRLRSDRSPRWPGE